MSQEANKTAAVALLQALGRGELDRRAFSDDAAWWMPGAGEVPIDAFENIFAGLVENHFGHEGRMAVQAVTAEGDRVAVEAESLFPLKDGRTYSNTYHFLVEFRDGKVRRVKEYCDTARAREIFGTAA